MTESTDLNWTYRVDEHLGVYIYNNTQEEPVFFQPTWPNGDTWLDTAEATEWAEARINEFLDPTAPLAGVDRDHKLTPRPTEEDVRMHKLQSLGLSVDDLKALLGL